MVFAGVMQRRGVRARPLDSPRFEAPLLPPLNLVTSSPELLGLSCRHLFCTVKHNSRVYASVIQIVVCATIYWPLDWGTVVKGSSVLPQTRHRRKKDRTLGSASLDTNPPRRRHADFPMAVKQGIYSGLRLQRVAVVAAMNQLAQPSAAQ